MKKALLFLFTLFLAGSLFAQTFIGVLHQDTGIKDLPDAVEPLFKFDNKRWSSVEKNECEKVSVTEWHILFNGKAREKIKTIPMETELQKGRCYLGTHLLSKVPKKISVVGSSPNGAADPFQWKLLKSTTVKPSVFGLSKNAEIMKAYRNKKNEHFLIIHLPGTSKDDETGSTLAGFWNSKNQKKWSTESTIVELIDAGDYNEDGQSEIVISEGEYGGGVRYSLFSSKLEKVVETNHFE